ncbi:MAG: hypothetical protein OEU25_23280, partial [Rhodospirillales bacterium]|nr:hypothetical protein [Rhodospirillales bacterium]
GTLLTGGGGGEVTGGGGGTGGAAGDELEPPPPQAASASEKIVNKTEASGRIAVSPIRPIGKAGADYSPARTFGVDFETPAAFAVSTVPASGIFLIRLALIFVNWLNTKIALRTRRLSGEFRTLVSP